jgi:hypothetical protein
MTTVYRSLVHTGVLSYGLHQSSGSGFQRQEPHGVTSQKTPFFIISVVCFCFLSWIVYIEFPFLREFILTWFLISIFLLNCIMVFWLCLFFILYKSFSFWNYCIFVLCPSYYGILGTRKRNVSESGSVSVLRWGKETHCWAPQKGLTSITGYVARWKPMNVCKKYTASSCHLSSYWYNARLILQPRRWRWYVLPKRRLTSNGVSFVGITAVSGHL